MRKDRIEARLSALGLTQFEAAEKAGRGSHFIYDFMIDRKKSFKGDGPIRLAQALECSIEYLTGDSEDVGGPPLADRLPPAAASGSLPVAGFVEAGAYRRPGASNAPKLKVPVAPVAGFPVENQRLFIVRGHGLDALGIGPGMVLTTVDLAYAGDLRSGHVVVVEHARGNGREVEVSARELQFFRDRTELRAASQTEIIPPLILKDDKIVGDTGKVRIIGRVVAATLQLSL